MTPRATLTVVPKTLPPEPRCVETTPAMRAAIAALVAGVGEAARGFTSPITTEAAMDRALLLLDRVPGMASDARIAIKKGRG